MTLGSKWTAEDPDACVASTFVVSVIPLADQTGTNEFTAEVASYEFSSSMEAPSTATDADSLSVM